MFHLTSIITRVQESLEKEIITQEEIISVRKFIYPLNDIKYNNLEETNKLRNKNRGYLILSNHNTVLSDFILIRSIIDAYTISAYENILEHSVNIGINYETIVTKVKLIGYKRLNSNNIETNGDDVKHIIIDKIETGNNIIIFPEGKLTHDTYLYPFKKGIFYSAYENKIPILPIIIDYKNEFYFNGCREPERINHHMIDNCGIDVNILKFIYPEDFNSFDEFYQHTYNKMNEVYVECRKCNKNNNL